MPMLLRIAKSEMVVAFVKTYVLALAVIIPFCI